jgi:chemotaxis protein methyltransferase CheR
VRGSVRFERGNLVEDDPGVWPPNFYDVIFCRNVLMYFSPERMRQVIDRFARSLVPGGFLFLGHVETLRAVSDAFHLHHTHGTFYYQLKAGDFRPDSAAPCTLAEAPASIDTVTSAGGWVETIQAASDRIARLIDAVPAVPVPEAPLPWDAAPVLDLVRRERFAEALDRLRQRPSEAASDPDTLLLEAALLAQSGQLAAAEIAAKQLIGLDELSAGAHYILALCREHDGHPDAAAEQHRIVCYLDPAFAMPRLHLGLLARRAGEIAIARRELGQALILLKREDPSRLLMFGGGFGRDALVSLCRTALEDCGGQA